jgi:HD superfamily phosphohydrolase
MTAYDQRRVQDAVHGLMEFRGSETAVIDVLNTPEVQRLGRIRQQGLTHRVFPSAEHSRLVHSLGAAHLAIRFCRQLGQASSDELPSEVALSQEDVRCLALAALCHDLGHGPLSHTWEREVIGSRTLDSGECADWRSSLGLPDEPLLSHVEHWHELVTQALLFWPDGVLHRRLAEYDAEMPERVRRALLGEYRLPYLTRLLVSDVDCDRCDYVRRDAAMSGVAYGHYDLDWLVSTMTVGTVQPPDHTSPRYPVIGFDKRKAQRVLEQFLIARRAMYDMVYWHKTVRSAEGMIGMFLRRLRDLAKAGTLETVPLAEPTEGHGTTRTLERFAAALLKVARSEAGVGPEDILYLDDANLFWFIGETAETPGADPILADLARRILDRNLFKEVRARDVEVDKWYRESPDRPQAVREVIATGLGLDDDRDAQYYLIEDSYDLDLMSNDDRGGTAVYVVDIEHPMREAELASSDRRIGDLARSAAQRYERLFVPDEVLDSVRLLAEGKRTL